MLASSEHLVVVCLKKFAYTFCFSKYFAASLAYNVLITILVLWGWGPKNCHVLQNP